jgi:hypothetical protein
MGQVKAPELTWFVVPSVKPGWGWRYFVCADDDPINTGYCFADHPRKPHNVVDSQWLQPWRIQDGWGWMPFQWMAEAQAQHLCKVAIKKRMRFLHRTQIAVDALSERRRTDG